MAAKKPRHPKIDGYTLNNVPDIPDYRDYIYEPPLIEIRPEIDPPAKLAILDQGSEGACTGFGLAAVINHLNARRGKRYQVSARMLYEMAKKYDEWPGADYEGSSCRAAIKGWYAMGVCREPHWRYSESEPGHLTVKRAKNARENRIGAYYRLNHRLADFHAAINETGAIYVSATVHSGWESRKIKLNKGIIPFEDKQPGDHAFAVVGYNEKGFWIQNSWDKQWGKQGLALWTYEDWYHNISDAWAFRLSLSTPDIWQISTRLKIKAGVSGKETQATPARSEIAGHFVHISDGKFHDHGRYWSNLQDVRETAQLVAMDSAKPLRERKYRHLLFYAHGGLNSTEASAKRIRAMREIFKENSIYPYHFMYDTGLMEELKGVILRRRRLSEERVGGLTSWTDRLLETTTRMAGRALWREMKHDSELPFEENQAGWESLGAFIDELITTEGTSNVRTPIKLHVIGHSNGAILLAHMLEEMERLAPEKRVSTVSLMAPATTIELFKSHYFPLLTTNSNFFGIDDMAVYNLSTELEESDSVAGLYRKSLLYLVSRSYEEELPSPLLGMQVYSQRLDRSVGKKVDFCYSDGVANNTTRTAARNHGDFDNDPHTLNDILKRILGKNPPRPFTKHDLHYDVPDHHEDDDII